MKLLILNGPNLNFLGIREKDIYGTKTFLDLINYVTEYGKKNNVDITTYQSNSEGSIIDYLYAHYEEFDGLIINGGAYAHTSIAIMDCIKGIGIKTVNVHLSNVMEREEFRHIDYLSLVSEKTFMGKGFESYKDAIDYFIKEVK